MEWVSASALGSCVLRSATVGGTYVHALFTVNLFKLCSVCGALTSPISVYEHMLIFSQPLPIGTDGDSVRSTDWVVSHVRSAVGNLQGKIRVSECMYVHGG